MLRVALTPVPRFFADAVRTNKFRQRIAERTSARVFFVFFTDFIPFIFNT